MLNKVNSDKSSSDSLSDSQIDSALRAFVGYRLKRAYRTMHADLVRALDPLDLRLSTYSTLVLIVNNPGLQQSAFALALDIERPNMVAIVDELEDRGWIKRERAPSDRRAYALYATQAGKRLCKKAIALDKAHESTMLDGMTTKEITQLASSLEKIESVGREKHW